MDYYTRHRRMDYLTARIVGSQITFAYSQESPRSFQRYNSLIQGMEWVKATETISTADTVAIRNGDTILSDGGLTLTVVNVLPQYDKRKAMFSRDHTTRYIVNLE